MNIRTKLFLTIKALLTAVLITTGLLFLLSFAFWKLELSDSVIRAVVLIIYVLSSFAGGYCEGKFIGERKYLWGIVIGFLYFILLCILTFATNEFQAVMQIRWLVILFICMMSGMLGGMIA